MAFLEAFVELNPVAEFSSVGSLKQFAVVSKDLIECVFKANVAEVIPLTVKTLTASGKVSIKPMPRSQFHELHQDYLCGCVIRMAREVFAMLPVAMLLVTAQADVIDPVTGQSSEQPVLSVAMPREIVATLDFDKLSAGDVLDRFLHRGDFRALRKAGAFRAITPLLPADLRHARVNELDVDDLDASIRALREAIRAETRAGKIATNISMLK